MEERKDFSRGQLLKGVCVCVCVCAMVQPLVSAHLLGEERERLLTKRPSRCSHLLYLFIKGKAFFIKGKAF